MYGFCHWKSGYAAPCKLCTKQLSKARNRATTNFGIEKA